MKTPQACYEATVKATPKTAQDKEHYRVRYDSVDQFGKLSLRRAGQMHHLGTGVEHRHKKVIIISDHYKATVVEKGTGEKISEHEINPSKTYWANNLSEFNEKKRKSPI